VTEALLLVVLLASVASFAVAILTFRSSRRSEDLGEDRYELLRDQRERLDLLREERRMLTEELERESRERRHLTQFLEETDPRLSAGLERRRQAPLESEPEAQRLEEERRRLQREHQEILRRAEELEREQTEVAGVQQEAQRLRQEGQRLAEDLERGREERAEVQRRAEQQEQELARLKQELLRSQAEPDREAALDRGDKSGASPSWRRRPTFWRRRPIVVAGILLGALVAWFTSLVVALNVLAS
jgi:chromosome segregation ATPase